MKLPGKEMNNLQELWADEQDSIRKRLLYLNGSTDAAIQEIRTNTFSPEIRKEIGRCVDGQDAIVVTWKFNNAFVLQVETWCVSHHNGDSYGDTISTITLDLQSFQSILEQIKLAAYEKASRDVVSEEQEKQARESNTKITRFLEHKLTDIN